LIPWDMETKLNEQELITKARNGDSEAFREIVNQYESRVAATVIGMLGHTTESEDVGQETFVRFYQSLNRFRGESSIGTYLTRIAINLSLNEIRRRKRRRHLYFIKNENAIENIPDTKDLKDQRETNALVQWGLQKLPPKFRSVIVLRLIDGYSTEETAKILGLPVGTVLSRLARAQMKLKEILISVFKGEISL
jgi:RNA polymerase sigma-70 factor (ECF subfamily)